MFAQKLGAMSVSDASSPAPADSTAASIDTAIERAHRLLLRTQEPDGHWVGELEADSTISSEYLLFCHILDRVDREREAKIVAYLRERQLPDGGWSLYEEEAGVSEFFFDELSIGDVEHDAFATDDSTLTIVDQTSAIANPMNSPGGIDDAIFVIYFFTRSCRQLRLLKYPFTVVLVNYFCKNVGIRRPGI